MQYHFMHALLGKKELTEKHQTRRRDFEKSLGIAGNFLSLRESPGKNIVSHY